MRRNPEKSTRFLSMDDNKCGISPPEKIVNAREDRLYQNPTNNVDVILCATRMQQSRTKMHNLGNDPWKEGHKEETQPRSRRRVWYAQIGGEMLRRTGSIRNAKRAVRIPVRVC
jgi:hypothetical protein